jgi:hypothetical protein
VSAQQQPRFFVVTLEVPPGDDGIRALRELLKVAWRRHRLRAVDIREHITPENELVKASRNARPDASYRQEFAQLRQAWKDRGRRTA